MPRKSLRKVRKSLKKVRKSTRKVRKLGYRMGADFIEMVRDNAEKIYPEPEFQYSILADENTVILTIECEEGDMTTLVINKDEIYVNYLTKCGKINGTRVLKKIIDFGKTLKHFGLKRIWLKDASSISYPNILLSPGCSSSLTGLMILTKEPHHSWYNKHGFVSENYEDEIEKNKKISKLPMIRLLEALEVYRKKKMEKIDKNFERFIDDSEMEKIIHEFIYTYEGKVDLADSIKNGIQKIYNIAKDETSCNSPKIKMYDELMKAAFTYLITYDNNLSYNL